MTDHIKHQTEHAAARVVCWVITVSDSRDETTDTSGKFIREQLQARGHRVALSRIIKNDPAQITEIVTQLKKNTEVHVAIFHGGTGLSPKDQTARTLKKLFDEELEGFGELFRMLSYHEIGPYALLSRACAGVINKKLVFSLPGAEHAVRLALERLILPVIAHAVQQL